jgi:hypothetical protein
MERSFSHLLEIGTGFEGVRLENLTSFGNLSYYFLYVDQGVRATPNREVAPVIFNARPSSNSLSSFSSTSPAVSAADDVSKAKFICFSNLFMSRALKRS